jgi:hypothetical protein
MFGISRWEFVITDGCPVIVAPRVSDITASKCSIERLRRSKNILITSLICFCHQVYNNNKSPMVDIIGPHPKNKRKSNNSHLTLFLEDLADELRSNARMRAVVQQYYAAYLRLLPEGVDTRWVFWTEALEWVFPEVQYGGHGNESHDTTESESEEEPLEGRGCRTRSAGLSLLVPLCKRLDAVATALVGIGGDGSVAKLTPKQRQLFNDCMNRWLRFQGMVALVCGQRVHRPALLWAEAKHGRRMFEVALTFFLRQQQQQ